MSRVITDTSLPTHLPMPVIDKALSSEDDLTEGGSRPRQIPAIYADAIFSADRTHGFLDGAYPTLVN